MKIVILQRFIILIRLQIMQNNTDQARLMYATVKHIGQHLSVEQNARDCKLSQPLWRNGITEGKKMENKN